MATMQWGKPLPKTSIVKWVDHLALLNRAQTNPKIVKILGEKKLKEFQHRLSQERQTLTSQEENNLYYLLGRAAQGWI